MGGCRKNMEVEHNLNTFIALAGNPNVGKSTLFNALTGLRQHTGNWSGKTVSTACGRCCCGGKCYDIIDLPGCYSLASRSYEEEVARDFICFGSADAIVVVCDATCLSRNLNLVLQILEVAPNVLVCVNLMDEAARKGIRIDINALSSLLGTRVVGTSAGSGEGVESLTTILPEAMQAQPNNYTRVRYPDYLEELIFALETEIVLELGSALNSRWLALKILENDTDFIERIEKHIGTSIINNKKLAGAFERVSSIMAEADITVQKIRDDVVSSMLSHADSIYETAVTHQCETPDARDRKIDRILTSKAYGFPIMLFGLSIIFWITLFGANYPSEMLGNALFWLGERIGELLVLTGIPGWIYEPLMLGVYRVLAWVIAVMLPPMAIFFPLFTLLEDIGYLPRVAFNLDKCYKKCNACGKQALTMCVA